MSWGDVRLGEGEDRAVGAGMLQAGCVESAQGKENRKTRPINSAIAANQDQPEKGRRWDLGRN